MYAPPPALNLVVIRAADLERARGFYSAMGLLLRRDAHESGPQHYVSVVGGLVFEIYPLAPGQPPTTGRRAIVADPDGHRVELFTPERERLDAG